MIFMDIKPLAQKVEERAGRMRRIWQESCFYVQHPLGI